MEVFVLVQTYGRILARQQEPRHIMIRPLTCHYITKLEGLHKHSMQPTLSSARVWKDEGCPEYSAH